MCFSPLTTNKLNYDTDGLIDNIYTKHRFNLFIPFILQRYSHNQSIINAN